MHVYLGHAPGKSTPTAYAAARRADLSGLPPAFVSVGDIELFLAEDMDYARRLEQGGVEVVLDIVPGAPHGFENWARDAPPSVALLQRARDWLGKELANPDLTER
jgi:acetyl esterase/lipase